MIVVGLDLSLVSTGWCIGSECGRIRPKKMSGIQRRAWIADEVLDVGDHADVAILNHVLFVIEAVPTHGAHSIVPLGMLHGVVLHRLYEWEAGAVAYVPGPTLKKFLAGSGNAKKEQMVAAAQALGYAGESHDEADAFGLALIGHHLLGGTDHLTPQRSALLASVAWEIPLPEEEA